jgi:hypothetical protein
MLSVRRGQLWAGLSALVGLFGILAFEAQGGGDRGEKVRFTTVDGVEIQGTFFTGKRNAPTIMMLHALGEDSRKKSWVSLAESLNKEGYAVLTFDFRGHGQSTAIDSSLFWKIANNVAAVKGAPKKESIEYKDMSKAYFPVLVNDIAAAKAFLDHRNDTGACNTSSFVVLGADTGATLGGIWLNAEWHRFRFEPLTFTTPATIAKISEGKDTIAAIWLSATSKLGSRTIQLSKLLEVPGKENATPMVFMYSDQDTSGKNIGQGVVKAWKGTKKDDKKFAYTGAVPIEGGGKLIGAGLLQKSLPTEKAIVDYIKDVAEAKGQEWGERDFRKTQYVWLPRGSVVPIPAKLPMEKTLVFDSYDRFLPK